MLQGRLETSWLLAWGLLLLTLVPLRVLVTSTGGRLAVRGGALLKRRLLFGALALETDSVRRRGAGQLLGRVLESEVLDAMAISGGFLALTAGIELILAAVVGLWTVAASYSAGSGPVSDLSGLILGLGVGVVVFATTGASDVETLAAAFAVGELTALVLVSASGFWLSRFRGGGSG